MKSFKEFTGQLDEAKNNELIKFDRTENFVKDIDFKTSQISRFSNNLMGEFTPDGFNSKNVLSDLKIFKKDLMSIQKNVDRTIKDLTKRI